MTGPQFATNAVVPSASRHGSVFVLRAAAGRDRLRIEVEDAGGPWLHGPNDDGRPHGFDVVPALAGAGNWGIGGICVPPATHAPPAPSEDHHLRMVATTCTS